MYDLSPLPLADLLSSATFITHFRSHLATFKIPPSLLASRGGGRVGEGSFCRFQWGGGVGGKEVWSVGRDWKVRIFFFRSLRLARVPRVEDKRGLMNATPPQPTPSDSPTSAIIIKLYHSEWNSWLVARSCWKFIDLFLSVSLISSLIWNSRIDLEASESRKFRSFANYFVYELIRNKKIRICKKREGEKIILILIYSFEKRKRTASIEAQP